MKSEEKFTLRWLETEPLIGGSLCLDFANTVTWRAGPAPIERLTRYEHWMRWLRRSGALSVNEEAVLTAEARKAPRLAAHVLREATAFRELLYRLFSAVAHKREPAGSDLRMVNKWMQRFSPQLGVVAAGRRFSLGWTVEDVELSQALWPIVRSAAELLTSEELAKVRECDGENCGWLFVDRSRNHLRRWCSMQDCGNRAKARQHYRKSQRAAR